jgi:hypothetical protein
MNKLKNAYREKPIYKIFITQKKGSLSGENPKIIENR